jgi:hypothetical protein
MLGNLDKIVYVEDMKKMGTFYLETLGLKLRLPDDPGALADSHWVEFDTGETTLCLHSGRKGDPGEQAPEFSFRAEDVHGAREELIRRGVPMGEMQNLGYGSAFCSGRDPEGNVFFISGSA